MSVVNLGTCLFIAGIVRLLLYAYGLWQDAAMTVKYTDIDYIVFTDAARFVSQVCNIHIALSSCKQFMQTFSIVWYQMLCHCTVLQFDYFPALLYFLGLGWDVMSSFY